MALILVAAIEGDGHRTGDAISHCREALDTLDRAGLGSSREWIGAANNPANILVATGRPEEGRTYLCEALTRGGRILLAPADTLILAQISANLAHVDLQLRYFEEAGANFRCALETFERCLGCNHPRTGELLVDYARLCWATKRKMEAKQFESRARECLNSHRYGLRDNTVDVSDLIGRSR